MDARPAIADAYVKRVSGWRGPSIPILTFSLRFAGGYVERMP
jgi:hypothetical protein